MKRSIFLALLLLHCPVSVANDLDLANRALERGDYATAASAFRKLSEQGNIKAQSHLGYLYYAGEGVPQSYEEAVKWYRKAATQGDPDAQYNLAVAYAFGEGVKKDLREAATWYRRAAEQGHPVAQYSLGISHAYGEGVKQDGALAARWFLQAAEQDYEPAQVMIASIYHTGDGIPQDHTKAARWYRKAAEKGNAVAQYNLGTLYRAGKGVVKNNAEAKRWFTRAARQGYAAAEKELQGMQQAVTVAPVGIPSAAAETGTSPEPKTEPEARPEPVPAPEPKTAGTRSEQLPSGDLTGEEERKRQAGPQSDEALVTIRKEDLLTLEPEPETEPLATVDEISGMEYQGAPTAKPAKLKEETVKETAVAKPAPNPFEKQPPVKADTVVTKPAETKPVDKPGVTEDETGTGESGKGVLGFFKKIFSADNKTETVKIGAPVPTGPIATPYTPRPATTTVVEEEQPQVAVEKKTTAGPIETAALETPYKPRPEPVTVTQPPEQTMARAETQDTGEKEVEEAFEWGRPRSRAPLENTESKATSYANGAAPAKQQLEESRTTETSRIEETDTVVETGSDSEDETFITVSPETSPTEEPVTGVTDNTEVASGGESVADESGGLGNFFKRLFGGDENEITDTEPEAAEQAVTEPATEQAEDTDSPDEIMESEGTDLIARAESKSVDIPITEDAGVVQEELPSFDDTLSLAVEGNAGSQYELATMYYKGDGVEQDLEQAFIWYRRAAQQGNPDAQFNLGNMYLLGEGTSQNDSKAKDWFEKAAAQGHVAAEDNLNKLQKVVASEDESPAVVIPVEEIQSQETVNDAAEPEPIKKTASVTKEELEAGAEPETSGDPGEDSYTRGMAYAYGEGAQQNYEMAFKYFQHAAEQGYVPAQYRLGVAYANGEGTEQDYVAALNWYQKAARRGYAIAQRSLCKMYLEGLGVEQNKPLALAWYSILAEHGNVMDTHRRDQLARELTEAEQQQAERLKQELTASITTASSEF